MIDCYQGKKNVNSTRDDDSNVWKAVVMTDENQETKIYVISFML